MQNTKYALPKWNKIQLVYCDGNINELFSRQDRIKRVEPMPISNVENII